MMDSRKFSLVVAHGAERKVVAAQTPFTIGRSPEMDLVLPYGFLSRRQAEIVWDEVGQEFAVVSVGAAGCFLNGEKVTRGLLRVGDEVRFGSVEGPMLRLAEEVGAAASGVTQAGVTQVGHSILDALGELQEADGGGGGPGEADVVCGGGATVEQAGMRWGRFWRR